MGERSEVLLALLDIKETMGELSTSVDNLVKGASDKEARIRKLEKGADIRHGVVGTIIFVLGSVAGWLGIKFNS